jgi:GNAT superfamily N-acetyltransferase
MTAEPRIIQLTAARIREAGAVLSRAFYDDPLMKYIFPDDAKRARLLPWYMSVWVRYGCAYGEVNTTAGDVRGVAVRFPPDTFQMSLARMMRTGIIFMPVRLGLPAFGRFMRAANFLEGLHKRDVAARHLYLLFLGTDPPHQGHGIGRALLQSVLSRADAERLPCYLETAEDRNVPFYRAHGFEVTAEDEVPGGGPHFWTMMRESRGAKAAT